MTKNIQFEQELAALVNRFSYDNDAETPDYVIARYLMKCLQRYINNEDDISLNDDDTENVPIKSPSVDNRYFDRDIYHVRMYADGTENWYYEDYLIQTKSPLSDGQLYAEVFLKPVEHISSDPKISYILYEYDVVIDRNNITTKNSEKNHD